MNISKELIETAKTAKSAEELLELAKTENINFTAEEAAKAFDGLNKNGELSDEELDNVSGGCSPSAPPKYKVGDYVKYYYQYEFTWTYECTATGTSFIEDIKADTAVPGCINSKQAVGTALNISKRIVSFLWLDFNSETINKFKRNI